MTKTNPPIIALLDKCKCHRCGLLVLREKDLVGYEDHKCSHGVECTGLVSCIECRTKLNLPMLFTKDLS